MTAEKALLSLQVKNESLMRQLDLARQNAQQLKVDSTDSRLLHVM